MAVDVGQDGGITLMVSFEPGYDDCGTEQGAPVDDAFAQAHYCAIFEEFSRELFYTTEGKHWIKRVRFMEDLKIRDIKWTYVTKECGDGTPCNERCAGGSDDGRGCSDSDPCADDAPCVATCASCSKCPTNSEASWSKAYLNLQEKGFVEDTDPYQPSRIKRSAIFLRGQQRREQRIRRCHLRRAGVPGRVQGEFLRLQGRVRRGRGGRAGH
jgi:hypothetical protein